jgi:hypothetical protein
VIEGLCRQTTSVDPITLCTEIMRSPVINMHGPEHHQPCSRIGKD